MPEPNQLLSPRPPEPAPQIPGADASPGGPFAPEQRPLHRRIGAGLLAAGALIVNFAAKFKVLLLALPKLKLLTTSGSMLVSVAAYSLLWGWQFAAGFVLLLLVHEMGHVIQLRREGVPASAPLFIPFLGAVVGMKRLPDNALAEARVGLAGPVLGSLGAAALIPVYLATGNRFWQALAFTGLFLNLINLLPMLPLDGGRAMAAMAPWMWFVGFGVMVAVAVAFPNPVILIILVFGALETWRRWKARRAGGQEEQAYYRVPPAARLAVAAVYIGLIVALGIGIDATHLPRTIAAA
ncbi:MAG: site-2 protease family protein [Actinomycetota bacterium]|nr:site-2 protease family protein [Actinomycetota bacterium]